jgi:DNA-binding PadR family transcriptional regulator
MKRFEEAYGDVLVLSSESHVYTALNELSRRGLIEELTDAPAARTGTNRQPKVRYRRLINATGIARPAERRSVAIRRAG